MTEPAPSTFQVIASTRAPGLPWSLTVDDEPAAFFRSRDDAEAARESAVALMDAEPDHTALGAAYEATEQTCRHLEPGADWYGYAELLDAEADELEGITDGLRGVLSAVTASTVLEPPRRARVADLLATALDALEQPYAEPKAPGESLVSGALSGPTDGTTGVALGRARRRP